MAMVGSGLRGLFGCVMVAVLLTAAHASAEDAISEEAKLYFKNGVELIQGQPPNYQDAYYQFKLAWEKSKSWKVLGNLGLCALKLERDGEAIWAYTEYLKQSGKDIDPEERKDLERDLLLLNGNAASVTLTADMGEVELVDSRVGSVVPPQSYRMEGGQLQLRLRAGSHTLTASAQGKTLRWEVTLSPGRTEEHRFQFNAVVAAAPVATPSASPPAPAPTGAFKDEGVPMTGGTLRTVGYVAAGAGLLAVGGGLLLGSSAKSQESAARDKCSNLPAFGFSCPASTRSEFDDAQSKARTANVLMILGGAVAAGGVVMIVVGGPKPASSARLELLPAVGQREAALFAQGAF